MASSVCSALEQDLSCPVCFEIFSDPVILSCSHSFCKVCLEKSWASKEGRECPLCKRRSSRELPLSDRSLKNACESYMQRKMERDSTPQHVLCSAHSEKLNLFCVDDKKLVCIECVSQNHQNHSFCSISKAAATHKETVKTHVSSLQSKLEVYSKVKNTGEKMAARIKVQAQQTEKQIKAEFEKLHEFLKEQEESRIAALRREEQEKSQKMKEQIEELDKQMEDIKSRIQEVEEKLKSDVLLLQDLKETIRRAQYTVPDPKLQRGALINVAEHVGNLRYRVWEKMKNISPYFCVVLDPNTAHYSLFISQDLSVVSCTNANSELPENPERVTGVPIVLGSESLISGTHSWEVDVGDSESWGVGVFDKSLIGKVNGKFPGFFIVKSEGKIKLETTNGTAVPITETNIKIICVTLSWEKGKVSFTESHRGKHLHSSKHKFTGEIYPVFYNHSKNPIKILPLLK